MFRRRALRRKLNSAGSGPLTDGQVAALSRAVEAGPAGGSACVPANATVRLAALRVWRWPDLKDPSEVRRLPTCAELECCNPYHWSRLCEPETPPPPYSANDTMEDKSNRNDISLSTEDARRTDHERLLLGSLTTDGEDRCSWESEWCRLAYWELARRVGRQFGVRIPAVDVFGGEEAGGAQSGLSLDALRHAANAPGAPPPPPRPPPERVKRTRAKIGLGVTLSLEPDGVWLYNKSNEPVFASSAALGNSVCRVASGHCLRIHTPNVKPPPHPLRLGPLDDRSVRLSFAKGWGGRYSRRDVTACPCWLEVLLAPS